MNESYSRKVVSGIFLAILLVLSFLIIKPIITSIIISFILAFIFAPAYNLLYKYTKSKNISASIIVLVLVILIFLPIWFLTPILIKQSFKVFEVVNKLNLVGFFKSIFPQFFASEQLAEEIAPIFSSFTSRIVNSFINSLAKMILNLPSILLHLFLILFTFYFILRDKEIVVDYFKGVLPFSKKIEKRIFEYSKGITASVIYGQFIIGIVQGITLGIGLFIFKIPNALFFTLLAILAGILPVIGTGIVWIPLSIYLFLSGGSHLSFWGVLIFGVISSTIDNFLRPMFVSRKVEIHSSILLVSMIGGFFFFGVLGLLLGPLIISYLLILIDVYKESQKSRKD